MNTRMVDCIDSIALMEEGPAHRPIIVFHHLGAD